MNVYDCANELAKALRESHELLKLKEAKEALDKDGEATKMVDEFLALSQEVELAKYQGKEPDKEKSDKLQKLYSVLALNKDAMEYLNAFMRFQMMMADISKTISEPVKGVIGEEK
ncbi:MAG: YlbF family regulator [Phascolarctobacterium sp.]|nr:YlbF family regulator [Phascolarctobacterium sp.]MCD8175264.1 YlbF family regulator [Phascolarctobacterium sp.]